MCPDIPYRQRFYRLMCHISNCKLQPWSEHHRIRLSTLISTLQPIEPDLDKVVRALWCKLQPETDHYHGCYHCTKNVGHNRLRDRSNHLDDDTMDLNDGDSDGDGRVEQTFDFGGNKDDESFNEHGDDKHRRLSKKSRHTHVRTLSHSNSTRYWAKWQDLHSW